MERYNPSARTDRYGSRLQREHSEIVANLVPWLSILLASLIPIFFVTTAIAWVPPLGFLTMIAWRIVRPGLLPLWAGLPLGAFDDLFSGQPLGSGILLFSLAMIAFELLEARFPWRNFAQDWFTAGLCAVMYILAAMLVSGATLSFELLIAMLPQIALSILIFPVIARIVARWDRLRLLRWVAIK